MDKPKLFIIFCLPSDLSGVPIYSLELINIIRENKGEFRVVTNDKPGVFDSLSSENVIKLRIKNKFSIISLIYSIYQMRRLRAVFPNAVFILQGSLFINAGRISKSVKTSDFIIYHGIPFDNGVSFLRRTFMLNLERLASKISIVRNVICLTIDNKKTVEEKLGIEVNDLLANFSRYDVSAPPQKPISGSLLTVGGFRKQKNYPYLLKLFDALPKSYTLTVCGPGTNGPEFERILHEYLSPEKLEKVVCLGAVADVRSLFFQHEIFVQTSFYEGMSLAAIEARNFGLKLALTKTSGTEELLNNWCGGVINFDIKSDVAELERLKACDFSAGTNEKMRFNVLRFRKKAQSIFFSQDNNDASLP